MSPSLLLINQSKAKNSSCTWPPFTLMRIICCHAVTVCGLDNFFTQQMFTVCTYSLYVSEVRQEVKNNRVKYKKICLGKFVWVPRRDSVCPWRCPPGDVPLEMSPWRCLPGDVSRRDARSPQRCLRKEARSPRCLRREARSPRRCLQEGREVPPGMSPGRTRGPPGDVSRRDAVSPPDMSPRGTHCPPGHVSRRDAVSPPDMCP